MCLTDSSAPRPGCGKGPVTLHEITVGQGSVRQDMSQGLSRYLCPILERLCLGMPWMSLFLAPLQDVCAGTDRIRCCPSRAVKSHSTGLTPQFLTLRSLSLHPQYKTGQVVAAELLTARDGARASL